MRVRWKIWLIAFILLAFISGCGCGGGSGETAAVSLVSIEVTPAGPTVALGTNQQFMATGTFSDNSKQDITTSVTWSSANMSIATISNVPGSNGLATSLAPGSTTITAALLGISGSTTLTVTNNVTLIAIVVTPAYPVAQFASIIQFNATGIYSDKSTKSITNLVFWTSSNTGVATISNASNSMGVATTDHLIGSTVITATLGNISGSTTLVDP